MFFRRDRKIDRHLQYIKRFGDYLITTRSAVILVYSAGNYQGRFLGYLVRDFKNLLIGFILGNNRLYDASTVADQQESDFAG